MSLVGTRPPTVDEWDKYELHHRARLATKPGLTGMWQVSGRSNITDLRKLTELRMKYPSMEEISNNDKLDYIKELEFFATGINQKIYDIKIVTKMSGSRLISQYDIALEEIVKQRRKGKEDST